VLDIVSVIIMNSITETTQTENNITATFFHLSIAANDSGSLISAMSRFDMKGLILGIFINRMYSFIPVTAKQSQIMIIILEEMYL